MTPHEALLVLIRADQNHAYSVSQTHWAHLPALAGNPHEFKEYWEASASPVNLYRARIIERAETLESAVRQLLAKLGKDWPETEPESDAIGKPDDIAPGWNPDRLTNAQVGDGYRLLNRGEIQNEDDQWDCGGKWVANWSISIGNRLTRFGPAHRRRLR